MKLQFSIAGVMGLTLIVALGLWSLLYANYLFAHVATTSLLAGGVVGWIVGFSYGKAQRGCIAGVLGGVLWTCGAALSDLRFWSHAYRTEAWLGLAAWAALGAVPMASTAAVYERGPIELIFRPVISCVIAVLIPGVPAALLLIIGALLNSPSNRTGGFPLLIVVFFSIWLLIGCGLAAFVGMGYGAAAALLRALEAEGRKYLRTHPARSLEPSSVTAEAVTPEHKDPAPVDPQ